MSHDNTTRAAAAKARPGSGGMFDEIAGRYDMLNRIMSVGIDQSWRRKTVDALNVADREAHVLDLATGTGDLAIRVAMMHAGARATGVDPSDKMLDVGRGKVAERGLSDRVALVHGSAESIGFETDTFDATCMAFGIRNVPDREAGLREMVRVTKPGGRIVILELGEPKEGWLSPFARFHIRKVVPRLGGMLSGSKEYRYLQESIAAFPSPDEFAKTMTRCGMNVLEVRPLTFGVCTLFIAESGFAS